MNEMLVTNKATTNNQCKQGGFDQEKKYIIDVGVSYNIHIMMIYHRLKFLVFH
jgi:hypothetical protein